MSSSAAHRKIFGAECNSQLELVAFHSNQVVVDSYERELTSKSPSIMIAKASVR